MGEAARKLPEDQLYQPQISPSQTVEKQSDNIVNLEEYRRDQEFSRQLKQAKFNSRIQANEKKDLSGRLATAEKRLGQGAQIAGQTAETAGAAAETAGKGIQTAGKAAEPVAKGAVGGVGGAVGGVGGAVGGAIAGSVVPGAGTLAGAAAGARSGASAGYKAGGAVGTAGAKGVQAAGKGIEKAGAATKKAGESTKKLGKKMKQDGSKKEAISNLKNLLTNSKKIGLVGYILFSLLTAMAVIIDVLPVVTGGLGSIIDWAIDFGFFLAVWICLVVITQDILGSMIGRKTVVNAGQTILEFIPVIDIIPFHILAIGIIFLDLKYGILDIKKMVKSFSK